MEKWGVKTLLFDLPSVEVSQLDLQSGAQTKFLFHKDSTVSLRIQSGSFELRTIDTTTGTRCRIQLDDSHTALIPPLQPYQILCVAKGSVLSTTTPPLKKEDNQILESGDTGGEPLSPKIPSLR